MRRRPVNIWVLHVANICCKTGLMKYGYALVSTDDQNADMQHAALKKAGCKKLFTDDGISGATTKRPALLRCLKTLQPGELQPREQLAARTGAQHNIAGFQMGGRHVGCFGRLRAEQRGFQRPNMATFGSNAPGCARREIVRCRPYLFPQSLVRVRRVVLCLLLVCANSKRASHGYSVSPLVPKLSSLRNSG